MRPRALAADAPPADLLRAAERVHYVGSPEHKDRPSFAGSPRPRADASIRDPRLAASQRQLTDWLREAIRKGQVAGPGNQATRTMPGMNMEVWFMKADL